MEETANIPAPAARTASQHSWQYALERWEEGRIALTSYRDAGPVALDSPDFKAWLADSLYWLSEYHRCVAARLDPWAPEEAQFVRFIADLVTSRSKKFFFREHPNSAVNLPFSEGEDAVYTLATEIARQSARPQPGWMDRFLGDPEQRRRQYLQPLLARYALRMPTLYEVLFNDDAAYAPALYRRAIFVRQGFDAQQFTRIAEQELAPIQHLAEQGQEAALRGAIRKLPLRLLHHQVPGTPTDLSADGGIRRAYALAMDAYSTDPLPLEQFSWHAAMILWKVEGLLQDAWEEHPGKREAMAAIGYWLDAYRAVARAAYAKRRTDYGELYTVHSRLVGQMFGRVSDDGQPLSPPLYPRVPETAARDLLDELGSLAPQR